jgi:hypothetical protein
MKALSVIAIAVGMACLLGSLLWAILFPASRSWTEDKNTRMTDLGVQAHKLGGELDAAKRRPSMHGRKPADIEAEYTKVKEELTQLREEFQGKRDGPKTMASILRWSGIAFIVAGALVVMATRSG